MLHPINDLLMLFLSAFLAATILPVQSEAVFGWMLLHSDHSTTILLFTATLGNVLGACVNWCLGRYCMKFSDRRWFPVKHQTLARAEKIYQQFGLWTLLFSWVPFIGDPLTVIAGMFRVRFTVFLTLVTIGKMARYGAIAMLLTS